MSKTNATDDDETQAEAPRQQDEPNESVPGYSTLSLQQGAEQLKRDLRPQPSYVAQQDRANLTLAAVATHQRKVGMLQLYSSG